MRRAIVQRAALTSQLGKDLLILPYRFFRRVGLKARCKDGRYVALDFVELLREHLNSSHIHFSYCWQGARLTSSELRGCLSPIDSLRVFAHLNAQVVAD